MTTNLPAIVLPPVLPACLLADVEEALSLAKQEKAASTRRAYESDFRIFEGYCIERGLVALPAIAGTVAAFLAWQNGQGAKPSTIGRRVASILHAHKMAGSPSRTDDERVRAVMRGIRRSRGVAPVKKAPAIAGTVQAMCANAGGRVAALRDKAVLLLGFSMAGRRSEIVGLDVADVRETEHGLIVTIRRSKTDQEGAGADVAVPFGSVACPVKALKAWLEAAGIESGPIFRPIGKGGRVSPQRLSGGSVASIVKAHAARLGLDATQFAGHSLRAGFVTSADDRGASIFKIMDVTRHKSVDTLRGYVRNAEMFRDHAGQGLL
jgi:site-specific recombinase XerD